MSDQSYLRSLAEEYLKLVAVTSSDTSDSEDRPHAASYQVVVCDQLLYALQLACNAPFDPMAWARSVVASSPPKADR